MATGTFARRTVAALATAVISAAPLVASASSAASPTGDVDRATASVELVKVKLFKNANGRWVLKGRVKAPDICIKTTPQWYLTKGKTIVATGTVGFNKRFGAQPAQPIKAGKKYTVSIKAQEVYEGDVTVQCPAAAKKVKARA